MYSLESVGTELAHQSWPYGEKEGEKRGRVAVSELFTEVHNDANGRTDVATFALCDPAYKAAWERFKFFQSAADSSDPGHRNRRGGEGEDDWRSIMIEIVDAYRHGLHGTYVHTRQPIVRSLAKLFLTARLVFFQVVRSALARLAAQDV